MNLEQLKTLLNDATGVIRMGTGAGEILRHELDSEELGPDTVLVHTYDSDDCVEFDFTCKALMEGTVSNDGIYLYVKDTRGQDQELKFNRKGYINLKPYTGAETQETTSPVVHAVTSDIDQEGTDVRIYGDRLAAWKAATDLAVNNAHESIVNELTELRDRMEYEKCIERWQEFVDAHSFGYICVGSQPVKGGVAIEKGKVSLREDGDYVIIEPAQGFWLDVTQQHPGVIVVKMQKSEDK